MGALFERLSSIGTFIQPSFRNKVLLIREELYLIPSLAALYPRNRRK
jgi:hypothetical protein